MHKDYPQSQRVKRTHICYLSISVSQSPLQSQLQPSWVPSYRRLPGCHHSVTGLGGLTCQLGQGPEVAGVTRTLEGYGTEASDMPGLQRMASRGLTFMFQKNFVLLLRSPANFALGRAAQSLVRRVSAEDGGGEAATWGRPAGVSWGSWVCTSQLRNLPGPEARFLCL